MASKHNGVEKDMEGAYVSDNGSLPGESFAVDDGIYAKLQRFAGKWNIEQRGIERVPENERTDRHAINACTLVSTRLLRVDARCSYFSLNTIFRARA